MDKLSFILHQFSFLAVESGLDPMTDFTLIKTDGFVDSTRACMNSTVSCTFRHDTTVLYENGGKEGPACVGSGVISPF